VYATNLALTKNKTPAFFAGNMYKSQLCQVAIILGVPIDQIRVWQAQTGMYFRLAGGWTGGFPREFESDNFIRNFPLDGSGLRFEGLRSFIAKSHAAAVILDSNSPAASIDLQPTLGAKKRLIGGVIFYRLRSG
jgi:hypothetical protein